MMAFFFCYAVLLGVGGLIGYKKAGSKVSLYAGLVSSIVLLAAVWMRSLGLIASVSLLLVGSFGVRYVKTKKFMPAGMLLALSILSSILSLLKLFG